jgi:hypothetical protein
MEKMKLINKYNFYIDVANKKFGITFDTSRNALLEEEHKELVTNKINNALEEFSLDEKDKLYFAKGVTIPRIKLKDLFAEKKIKSIRDFKEADKVIISKRTASKLFKNSWSRVYKTKFILKLIELLKTLDYYFNEDNLDEFTESLEFYENDYVECNYLNNLYTLALKFDIINKFNEKVYDDMLSHNSDSWKYLYTLVDNDDINFYNFLIDQPVLYSEKGLLKLINGEEAVVINENMYNSISDMFKSSDNDNTTLAIEILANSNYDESIAYILLALRNYGPKISDSRSKNYVNFKSLLAYLDIAYPDISEREAFKILKTTNNFTLENVSVLFKEFAEHHFNFSDYINTESVSLDDSSCEILNKKLIYFSKTKQLIIEDYEPSPNDESGSN